MSPLALLYRHWPGESRNEWGTQSHSRGSWHTADAHGVVALPPGPFFSSVLPWASSGKFRWHFAGCCLDSIAHNLWLFSSGGWGVLHPGTSMIQVLVKAINRRSPPPSPFLPLFLPPFFQIFFLLYFILKYLNLKRIGIIIQIISVFYLSGFVFWDTSLCSLRWHGIHCVDEAGRELTEIWLCLLHMPGLKTQIFRDLKPPSWGDPRHSSGFLGVL